MAVVRRTRIKICGVREPETALAAAQAGADAIGLVFAAASPRCVNHDQARQIIKVLPSFVEPVGLFVDAPVRQIQAKATELGLQTVQLHGRETPGMVAQLAPMRVIKAIAFEPTQVQATLAPWRPVPDSLAGLLWDAPKLDDDDSGLAPPSGGSGSRFDWAALAKLKGAGSLASLPPMILAGGLTPDNVGQAITQLAPYAVDVSSGVESSRGEKDETLIAAFCAAVRYADAIAQR